MSVHTLTVKDFPCCVDLPIHACRRHYPGGMTGCHCRSLHRPCQPSPAKCQSRLPHYSFRGLLNVHYPLQPACSPSHQRDLLHRRLQPSCYLHDCSDCYRRSDSLPGGSTSHWEIAPFHGAHQVELVGVFDGSWPSFPVIRRRGDFDMWSASQLAAMVPVVRAMTASANELPFCHS